MTCDLRGLAPSRPRATWKNLFSLKFVNPLRSLFADHGPYYVLPEVLFHALDEIHQPSPKIMEL